MKFSSDTYELAQRELDLRRNRAEKLAEVRRKEFIAKYPELLIIENEMKSAALEFIKAVNGGSAPVDAASLTKKNLEAQHEKKELLKAAGYPEDYLEPQYSCKECCDKGEKNGRLCKCHLELLKELSVKELSCSPMLAASTFDTFDIKYYSTVKDSSLGYSPRDYMRGSFEMIKAYAENFTPKSGSLFFCGATGLGKTHLSLAVMNKVRERGYTVYYGSAGNIIKEMEKERFGRSSGDIESDINDSDLLIIDDLGTEFKTSFSESAVYELINNAILAGKAMIINSNLTKFELEERYTQRVASRLNSFEVINFCGEDVRQLKK